jgi:hypothetical protein
VSDLIDELGPKLGELTDENAWKYVAATVMWAEKRKVAEKNGGTEDFLHLNDRLRTKSGQDLARRGLMWMDDGNFIAGKKALRHIDRIGQRYDRERKKAGKQGAWQRNNVTGRSFETVIQELIARRCGSRPSRESRLHSLQGFELAPSGYHSQPDLALFSERNFRILISTKWTLRKERIGTYLHEAYFYRRRRPDLQVAFVVAEFNPNILEWLVNDPLVDRVYHLHLPMFLAVHDPFGTRQEIPVDELRSPSIQRRRFERWVALGSKTFDLSQLFKDIRQLRAESPTSDPEDGEDDVDDASLEL